LSCLLADKVVQPLGMQASHGMRECADPRQQQQIGLTKNIRIGTDAASNVQRMKRMPNGRQIAHFIIHDPDSEPTHRPNPTRYFRVIRPVASTSNRSRLAERRTCSQKSSTVTPI